MNYQKKIVTNNISVKNYDFYDENNILICDFEDFSELYEFMQKPYRKIDENIINKYGFKNWIHYVFDLDSFQKIELF